MCWQKAGQSNALLDPFQAENGSSQSARFSGCQPENLAYKTGCYWLIGPFWPLSKSQFNKPDFLAVSQFFLADRNFGRSGQCWN